MKKTHKFIFAIAMTLVLCIGASFLAQAFFQAFAQNGTAPDASITIDPPESGVYVDVNTELALMLATKDPAYNAQESVSEVSKRVIIRLTDNITLSENLLITRDCHIDLNGFTLDTGSYTARVYHTYAGTFAIANGVLTGNLSIHTPNAAPWISLTNTAEQVCNTEVEKVDDLAVCQAALSMICARLSNNLDLDVHGIYGMLDVNTCELPNYSTHFGCTHANGCCFWVDEPILPDWFRGYDDLAITYTTETNNSATITYNDQSITIPEDTLTVNVSYGEATDTRTFMIHKLSADNDTAMGLAAASVFIQSMKAYLTDAALNRYTLYTALMLPETVSLGGYAYTMSYAGSTDLAIEDNIITSIIKQPGTLMLNSVTSIQLNGNFSVMEENDYTRANVIIKQQFPLGFINITYTYQLDENGNQIEGTATYTDQSLAYNPDDFPYGDFTIEYSLANNENGHYEIDTENQVVKVVDGKAPDTVFEEVYLQAKVYFGYAPGDEIPEDAEYVLVNVPIQCNPSTSDDDTTQVDKFLPYYHYYDKLFTETTIGNNTYRSFSIPASHTAPLGTAHIKFYLVDTSNYSFIDISNSNATSDQLTAIRQYLNVQYDATNDEWDFVINPENIGLVDRNLVFGYGFFFDNESVNLNNKTDADFTKFTQWNASGHFTPLTLPGVVNTISHCPDEILYEKLYLIYHSIEDQNGYQKGTDYILASRLDRAIDQTQLDFSDNADKNDGANGEVRERILDFTGIELLHGAIGINLHNAGITLDDLALVGKMTNLEYLDISENGFTDGEDFNVTDNVFEDLTGLDNLKILHVENNTIYDFSALSEFESLEQAYVYGNSPTVDMFANDGILAGLFDMIDGLLTDVAQTIYGSTGSTNIGTYVSLAAQNVKIYATVAEDGTPEVFSPSSSTEHSVAALKNIEYQNKIYEGEDITKLYESFSTNVEDYGIPLAQAVFDTYEDANGNITQTKRNDVTFERKIEFKLPEDTTAQDATYFILVYTDYVSADPPKDESDSIFSQWFTDDDPLAFHYSIEIKFPVERIPAETNN